MGLDMMTSTEQVVTSQVLFCISMSQKHLYVYANECIKYLIFLIIILVISVNYREDIFSRNYTRFLNLNGAHNMSH